MLLGANALLLLGICIALGVLAAASRRRDRLSFEALQKLALLDGNAQALGQLVRAASDIRSTCESIDRSVSETRGRMAAGAEAQTALSTAVIKLHSLIPLQTAEGVAVIQDRLAAGHLAIRQEAEERDARHAATLGDRLDSGQRSINEALAHVRTEIGATLKNSVSLLEQRLEELRGTTDAKLAEIITRTVEGARALNDTATGTISSVSDRLQDLKGSVDRSLKEELGAIRAENASKLEEMRRTVDEKLHATLQQRLGDSFRLVSERLELVHRGLGEMQTLATGVGDLKKVLSNIKTRGTWGEVQLGTLLEQMLTAEQFARNVETRPSSGARVEFAIRFPGRGDSGTMWLPIDAKFPLEDYQRLVDAQERSDLSTIEEAGKALEARIKSEARTIRERYVEPPSTTDFAILYLPTEGLYAEVLRRPGVADWCQRECKVNVAGPTTLGALLNSFQMGFRTLAIEKRSSEVWSLLGAVKAEFEKFGSALAHTKRKLEEAHSSIETTEQRNRVLTRKLRRVDSIEAPEQGLALGVATSMPQLSPALQD